MTFISNLYNIAKRIKLNYVDQINNTYRCCSIVQTLPNIMMLFKSKTTTKHDVVVQEYKH